MGSSRAYNATTDYMLVTDQSAIQNIFNSGGSICAWINFSSSAAAYRIMDKTGGSTLTPSNGWMCYIQNSGGVQPRFYKAFSTNYGIWYVSTSMSTGTWYHIAYTYNASSTANNPSIYINGVSQTVTKSSSPSGTTATDVSYDLYLGGNHNHDRGWNGTLCHFQAWNKVLTNDEIYEAMYKPGTVRSSLVGYWPSMGSDSPECDLSGNGNTAAITSATESFTGPKITKSR